MATKIRKHTSEKQQIRYKRKKRIRAKIEGNGDSPRLSVFRSNSNMYAQLIDDIKGTTIASASTLEEEVKVKSTSSIEGAKAVGALLAQRAKAKGVQNVIFDRSGYLYHGRVKALADSARESGLQF